MTWVVKSRRVTSSIAPAKAARKTPKSAAARDDDDAGSRRRSCLVEAVLVLSRLQEVSASIGQHRGGVVLRSEVAQRVVGHLLLHLQFARSGDRGQLA